MQPLASQAHDDLIGAVLADEVFSSIVSRDASASIRDFAFVIEISEPMVGQPFGRARDVFRRLFGQRPSSQNAFSFEHEIPVQTARAIVTKDSEAGDVGIHSSVSPCDLRINFAPSTV